MFYLRKPFTESIYASVNEKKLQELFEDGRIDGNWEAARSKNGPWFYVDLLLNDLQKDDVIYDFVEDDSGGVRPVYDGVPNSQQLKNFTEGNSSSTSFSPDNPHIDQEPYRKAMKVRTKKQEEKQDEGTADVYRLIGLCVFTIGLIWFPLGVVLVVNAFYAFLSSITICCIGFCIYDYPEGKETELRKTVVGGIGGASAIFLFLLTRDYGMPGSKNLYFLACVFGVIFIFVVVVAVLGAGFGAFLNQVQNSPRSAIAVICAICIVLLLFFSWNTVRKGVSTMEPNLRTTIGEVDGWITHWDTRVNMFETKGTDRWMEASNNLIQAQLERGELRQIERAPSRYTAKLLKAHLEKWSKKRYYDTLEYGQ